MSDEWLDRVRTNLAVLAELFPATFTEAIFEGHKPLKLGIDRDLVELGVLTLPEVKAAMRHYVNRVMYNRACVVGAPRYDLAGNAVGVVSESEAECALARLREIRRRRDRQAEELRDAHRNVCVARREEQREAEWKVSIEKARAQRLEAEAKLAAKRAAKVAAESEFAATKDPVPNVGDGLSALRAAAAKREAEAVLKVAS
jgi:sRNA-binding protein